MKKPLPPSVSVINHINHVNSADKNRYESNVSDFNFSPKNSDGMSADEFFSTILRNVRSYEQTKKNAVST